MKSVIIVLAFLMFGMTSFAQNTRTEVDVESLQREMEEQFKKLPQDVSKAMEQMREQMNTMQFKSDANGNEIIVNGDTIIIQNGEIFGMNMEDMFQKLPEGMEQLDFFFQKDGEVQQLLDMFENFSFDELPNFENLQSIPAPQDVQPQTKPKKHKQRRDKDEKGRKIYSL